MNKVKGTLKTASLGMALLTAGLVGTTAIAGPQHNHDRTEHKEKIYKQLDLTEAQQAQVKAAREQRHAQMKQTKMQMKDIKKQMHQLMQQQQLDQARLRALLHEEADLKADKIAKNHMAKKEFRAMLTVEQQAKLDAMKSEMKERKYRKRKYKEQG